MTIILGLSNTNKSWHFSKSGEAIFTNWCQQEPNLENRQAILDHNQGCWKTTNEDKQNLFICESKTKSMHIKYKDSH